MRLIDADALNDEMYHKSFEVDDGRNVWNSGLWIRYKIFEEAIRDAPTVDAVPARHGRWLNKRYGVKFDGHSYPFRAIATCSECHETSCDAGDYCPNCGAKMDEERKEE